MGKSTGVTHYSLTGHLSLPKTRIGWFSSSHGLQRQANGRRRLPPVPSMSRLSRS